MIDKTAGNQRMETLAMDTLQRQHPFQPPVLSVSPNAEEEPWVGVLHYFLLCLSSYRQGQHCWEQSAGLCFLPVALLW